MQNEHFLMAHEGIFPYKLFVTDEFVSFFPDNILIFYTSGESESTNWAFTNSRFNDLLVALSLVVELDRQKGFPSKSPVIKIWLVN